MRIGYVLTIIPALALATGKPQPPPKPAPNTATATATANQQQTSTASQSQTATGGNAAATQSQTANGGAGGNSNQTQTASNAGNQQVSSYEYERQTAMAYAPSIQPTTVCATGRSGGISTSVVGISGGASGVDIQCQILEAARVFAEIGYRETAALIACTSHAAVRAFNGRPCPVPTTPTAPADQSVTLRIEDVREERAQSHGFTPATK